MPGAQVLSAAAVTAPAAVAPVPAPLTAVAVTAVTPVTAVAVTPVAVAAEVLPRGLSLDDLDRHERQLAAVVDLADLDLDLVADLDHVVNVLDAHAAVQLAYLGDVQQPVLARQQRHEGAERGGLHHCPQEALADLGNVRVRDRVDRRPGGLRRGAVRRADVDRAVVLNRDLRARFLLDRVDHLALRPDDLADLVDGDLDRDDPGSVLAHVRRRADRLAHHAEYRQPRVARLGQRAREHRRRYPVELGVELQRRDDVLSPGDLEVHVA